HIIECSVMKVLSLVLTCALALPALPQQTTTAPPPAPERTRRPAQTPPSTPPSTEPEAPAPARQMAQEQAQPARESERERERPQQTAEPQRGGGGGATNTNFHFDMKETSPNVTHHSVTVNGRALRYTATAGRMPIKNGEG